MNDPLRPKVRYRRHEAARIATSQAGPPPARRSILTLGSKMLARNHQDQVKDLNSDSSVRSA